MRTFLKTIFVVIGFIFVSCHEFKDVQCTGVKGFKVNKMGMDGIDADIMLGIKNPNDIGFSIYPSEFDVSAGGVNLGKAHLTKRVHIDAKEEKTYTFHLKSNFKDVNLMDLTKLMSGKASRSIRIKGDLKAGKFYVKKRFPIDVNEKLDLDF
ncbi:MAG: LEA type 2 family protein [Sediminibacterium sp.]|nr:LEA type 2 family protein [Sediminibacterium sp.]